MPVALAAAWIAAAETYLAALLFALMIVPGTGLLLWVISCEQRTSRICRIIEALRGTPRR